MNGPLLRLVTFSTNQYLLMISQYWKKSTILPLNLMECHNIKDWKISFIQIKVINWPFTDEVKRLILYLSTFFSNICTINHLLTAFWLICALFSEWISSFFLEKMHPRKTESFANKWGNRCNPLTQLSLLLPSPDLDILLQVAFPCVWITAVCMW